MIPDFLADTFVKDDKRVALNKLYGENLFVYNNDIDRDINTLLYAMEDCLRVYGTRVFVLDNFMQIEIKSQDVYQEQTNI